MVTISVVIPTYNRCSVLTRAITSVAKQSYSADEVIVIDDGSTDDTRDVITQLKSTFSNLKIVYIKTPNRGVSAARNTGISASKNSWISFLDSDDEWLPKKLKLQVDALNSDCNLRIIHGNELWIKDGKHLNQKLIHKKSGGDIFLESTERCLISPSAVLIEKKLLEEMNGFDEKFEVCEDYFLWLKITAKHTVGFVNEPILKKYGGHDDQLSRKYFGMDYWRVKALAQVIEQCHLKDNYKVKATQVLISKASILLDGYLKHSNMKYYDEISNIRENFKINEHTLLHNQF